MASAGRAVNLEEAIAIRQMAAAPAHLQREATRVIQCANAMQRAQSGRVEFVGMTRIDLERINAVLVYRLALACGKLNDWREH